MTITLTPEIESVVADQARQRGVTPEQLALDGLRYLFATPEPSEEEETWYRVQAQLLLAQVERVTEEMAQDDNEAEQREREARRAERAAISEETRRVLDQISLLGQPSASHFAKDDNAAENDEAREQDLTALCLENQRLYSAMPGKSASIRGSRVGAGLAVRQNRGGVEHHARPRPLP